MRILTRYVVFDLLTVFLLILTGLTLTIFILLVGKEAVDKGLGLGPLLRMVPYLLPQAMQFAVPATMLLATTYVYGRMSSYNEIVAIKALGISPMTVIWPALALATLVSFAGVALNDLAVSWGRNGLGGGVIEALAGGGRGPQRLGARVQRGDRGRALSAAPRESQFHDRPVDDHRATRRRPQADPADVCRTTVQRPARTIGARRGGGAVRVPGRGQIAGSAAERRSGIATQGDSPP